MDVRHVVATGYLKKWVLMKKIANKWVFCDNVYDVITIGVADEHPYTVTSNSVEMTEADFLIKTIEVSLRPMTSFMEYLNYPAVYRNINDRD